MGITRQGRIAVLTNFRDDEQPLIEGAKSRGVIVKSYLCAPPHSKETAEDFAKRLIEEEGSTGVGGFSLIYGRVQDIVRGQKGMAIISNRTADPEAIAVVLDKANETKALSNTHHDDYSWPKVVDGERIVKEAIKRSIAMEDTKEKLIERMLTVLSIDTLPKREGEEELWTYLRKLRYSIFIPAIGGPNVTEKQGDEVAAADQADKISVTSGVYGTQKQTVILVDKQGKVTYVERSLFGEGGAPVPREEQDLKFDFDIEDW